MAKLLPPIIESKLPAQIGDTLCIPYLDNPSVGNNQYTGTILKIKSIFTNVDIDILENNQEIGYNYFSLKNSLQIGQYYKAQLAYQDNQGNIGYYSTMGVFKYTAKPSICILSGGIELDSNKKNYVNLEIMGKYVAPEKDPGEKIYSYCFNLYEDNNLLSTSGELLHNSNNDDINTREQLNTYLFTNKLNPLKNYTIEYKVITLNNLTIASPKYSVAAVAEVPNLYNFSVNPIVDYENGTIKINIRFKDEQVISGQFRVLRSSSKDNYGTLENLGEFIINNDLVEGAYHLYTDYTVEQGIKYKYGLQQYSDHLSTELIESEPVFADFEDAYLFDGIRQLKIKFNPKVSSFKNTVLENKLDTIGGQYPFIFRNGRTKYKEFPISGLISYYMDNEELFMPKSIEDISMNLTGENISIERQFKLEVLNWLNNGQPKLFRSPTEGNYVVRLLNVSLSPEDILGRMLHTFTCTAYEISNNNYSSLKKLNLVKGIEDKSLQRFFSFNYNQNGEYKTLPSAIWARIYGDIGSKYQIDFVQGEPLKIELGATGIYEIYSSDRPIVKITLIEQRRQKLLDQPHQIEYATTKIDTTFIVDAKTKEKVKSIETYEQASYFNSQCDDIIAEITKPIETKASLYLDNILFLRLRYNENNIEENGKSSVAFSFGDGKDTTIDFMTNSIEFIGHKQDMPYHQTNSGCIEYYSADFKDNKFRPTSIKIDDNIIVDIYYRVKKVIIE